MHSTQRPTASDRPTSERPAPSSPSSSSSHQPWDECDRALRLPATEVVDAAFCLRAEGAAGEHAPGVVIAARDAEGVPLAFVVPRLLSEGACDALIAKAEEHGVVPADKKILRSAARTKDYLDHALSAEVWDAFAPEVFAHLRDSDSPTHPVAEIHPNWRVVKYAPGHSFPPHRDQSDHRDSRRPDGTKDFLYSSHTLLVNLSKEAVVGGATRIFVDAAPTGRDALGFPSWTEGSYTGRTVDVVLPRGWALVFRQRHTLHCGMRVESGTKIVAQAGIMRVLPLGEKYRPCTFRLGPGLTAKATEKFQRMFAAGY